MYKLTGDEPRHTADELIKLYQNEANRLASAGSYFLAAISLSLALEAALTEYLVREWKEKSGREIPNSLSLPVLTEAAKELDLLGAREEPSGTSNAEFRVSGFQLPEKPTRHLPTSGSELETGNWTLETGAGARHVANGVAGAIRKFRDLIHPARALGKSVDLDCFTAEMFQEYKDMYSLVLYSLTRERAFSAA